MRAGRQIACALRAGLLNGTVPISEEGVREGDAGVKVLPDEEVAVVERCGVESDE